MAQHIMYSPWRTEGPWLCWMNEWLFSFFSVFFSLLWLNWFLDSSFSVHKKEGRRHEWEIHSGKASQGPAWLQLHIAHIYVDIWSRRKEKWKKGNKNELIGIHCLSEPHVPIPKMHLMLPLFTSAVHLARACSAASSSKEPSRPPPC